MMKRGSIGMQQISLNAEVYADLSTCLDSERTQFHTRMVNGKAQIHFDAIGLCHDGLKWR